jgi:hypothetical protein
MRAFAFAQQVGSNAGLFCRSPQAVRCRLAYPSEKMNCYFNLPSPNILWMNDFTNIATFQGFGTFVIGV